MTKSGRIMLLCALTQNLSFGIMFGSFGPLLPSTVERFGISLATATMAMSMATLAITGSAPIIGILVQRLSAGTAMTIAAALSACCYAMIATALAFLLVMASYALLGACAVTLGIIGPVTLVNQSASTNRGKMLGLIHMPIFLMLTPVVIAEAFPLLGRTGILMVIATLFSIFAPLIWVQTRHGPRDDHPVRATAAGGQDKSLVSNGSRRRNLALVLVSLAIGVVSGSSVVFMAHIVPFGLSRDMTLPAASLLISLFSGFGIIGSPVAGWLCDRIGPYWTLMGAALAIAALWIALPSLGSTTIFLGGALLGFFAVPVNTLHGAAISTLYGPDEVGKAMGISYLIKLPLLFGLAPIVAMVVDRFGSYADAFGLLTLVTITGAIICGSAMAVARALPRPVMTS